MRKLFRLASDRAENISVLVPERPGAALAVGMNPTLFWLERSRTGPWQTSCDMRPKVPHPMNVKRIYPEKRKVRIGERELMEQNMARADPFTSDGCTDAACAASARWVRHGAGGGSYLDADDGKVAKFCSQECRAERIRLRCFGAFAVAPNTEVKPTREAVRLMAGVRFNLHGARSEAQRKGEADPGKGLLGGQLRRRQH